MLNNDDKPLILVTNDDGITSKGIEVLVNVAAKIGHVVVVAPDSPQSGMGHAITIFEPLRLRKSSIFGHIEAYECSGTPADCVKIAKNYVLKNRNIDIVLSGVNHGSNSSISVIYSGTMSAAIEAAIECIPAIGFSLCDYGENAEFAHTHTYIEHIILQTLTNKLPKHTALNVNLPPQSQMPIKGIKICRQALAKFQEEYEKRTDPYGRDYFWTTGDLVNNDTGTDTDEWALANGFVSIVPCMFDLTSDTAAEYLQKNWKW
ncbi:MAG: 5'/3'-nucleotidase SurE [Cytophagales bacterium]|nr:5'/3'-nucleotidase SurE [Cytophagales bacterium]